MAGLQGCGDGAVAIDWGRSDGALDTGVITANGVTVFTWPGALVGLDECQFDLANSSGDGTGAAPLSLCPRNPRLCEDNEFTEVVDNGNGTQDITTTVYDVDGNMVSTNTITVSQGNGLVNGDGVALAPTFGPGGNSYCVQEPLRECPANPAQIAKDAIIWTEDTKPREISTRLAHPFQLLDATAVPVGVPQNGPTISSVITNTDPCRSMQLYYTIGSQSQITTTYDNGVHGAFLIQIFAGFGGPTPPLTGGLFVESTHNNPAEPLTATAQTNVFNSNHLPGPILAPGAATTYNSFTQYTRRSPTGAWTPANGASFGYTTTANIFGRSL